MPQHERVSNQVERDDEPSKHELDIPRECIRVEDRQKVMLDESTRVSRLSSE
jgi:hypothetical protein